MFDEVGHLLCKFGRVPGCPAHQQTSCTLGRAWADRAQQHPARPFFRVIRPTKTTLGYRLESERAILFEHVSGRGLGVCLCIAPVVVITRTFSWSNEGYVDSNFGPSFR